MMIVEFGEEFLMPNTHKNNFEIQSCSEYAHNQ